MKAFLACSAKSRVVEKVEDIDEGWDALSDTNKAFIRSVIDGAPKSRRRRGPTSIVAPVQVSAPVTPAAPPTPAPADDDRSVAPATSAAGVPWPPPSWKSNSELGCTTSRRWRGASEFDFHTGRETTTPPRRDESTGTIRPAFSRALSALPRKRRRSTRSRTWRASPS